MQQYLQLTALMWSSGKATAAFGGEEIDSGNSLPNEYRTTCFGFLISRGVQEQIANEERFLIDPQNFGTRGGTQDHLVLIL